MEIRYYKIDGDYLRFPNRLILGLFALNFKRYRLVCRAMIHETKVQHIYT